MKGIGSMKRLVMAMSALLVSVTMSFRAGIELT